MNFSVLFTAKNYFVLLYYKGMNFTHCLRFCLLFTLGLQFAIKNRWKRSRYDPKRKHWLDWAEEKYSVTIKDSYY